MGFIFICSVLTLITIVGGAYFYYQDKKEESNYIDTHNPINTDSDTAVNFSRNFTNPAFLKRLTQYPNNKISDN